MTPLCHLSPCLLASLCLPSFLSHICPVSLHFSLTSCLSLPSRSLFPTTRSLFPSLLLSLRHMSFSFSLVLSLSPSFSLSVVLSLVSLVLARACSLSHTLILSLSCSLSQLLSLSSDLVMLSSTHARSLLPSARSH